MGDEHVAQDQYETWRAATTRATQLASELDKLAGGLPSGTPSDAELKALRRAVQAIGAANGRLQRVAQGHPK